MTLAVTSDLTSRYSRHKLLREIGDTGQKKISQTRFLVIGAGGVGCPAALYLAEAGVGSITIVDADKVDASNLTRQILHTPARIGMNKAISAKVALNELNPDVAITAIDRWADDTLLVELMKDTDVILDCSDNFKTRHAVNRVAHSARKPLVVASSVRFSLQIAFFDFSSHMNPCYQCTFPEDKETDIKASSTGVFAPVTGISGMIAAGEALKFIAGTLALDGKLLVIDTLNWNMSIFDLNADPNCSVCSGD